MASTREVRARNESAWLVPNDGTRTNHRLRADMRRYGHDDVVDLVIIGAGAGGATLAQRLARAGWSIVVLDAGPFWDPPDTDWVSDERGGSHGLYWTDPRQIGGSDPVPWAPTTPGVVSVDRWSITLLHAAVSPFGLPHAHRRRSRCRLADRLPGPAALLRADRS